MLNKKVAFISFYDAKLLEICPYFIPTGGVYCATSLYYTGWDIYTHLIEYDRYETDYGNEISRICEMISEQDIRFICFSGLYVDYLRIRKVISDIKRNYPNTCIVIGGGVAAADPTFALNNCLADFGIVGEGEYSLPKLLDSVIVGGDHRSISGLCYRENGEIICNKACDITDLDALPFPKYSLFPEFENEIKRGKIYPILLSRSCPFSCTFCFHTSGKTYRIRSIDNVFQEIDEAIRTYGITHLFIIDELFGANKHQLAGFARKMVEYPHLTFNVQTRADLISDEMLQLVKQAGCTNLSIGIESASNAVLSSMRKGTTIDMIEEKLEMIVNAGLKTSGNIIIGDIAETYETAQTSIEWFKRNWKKYNLNIGHIQIYPGTYIFEQAVGRGLIDKEKFLMKAEREPDFVVNITKMNDSEYTSVYREINKLRFMSEREKDYLFN